MTSVWRHFTLLLLLGALFVYLADLLTGAPVRANGWAGAPLDALIALPHALYLVLPVAAGIAVGTLRSEQRAIRAAWRVVALATALMLLLDAIAFVAGNPDTLVGSLQLVAGRLPETRVVLERYPVGHPRSVAADATLRLGMLLLPGILVGMVMGLVTWVRDRVTFRSQGDERVAHWVLAWLLVPPVTALIVSWSSGYGADVLFRGEPLLLYLVPYVPAVVVAVLGWRRAARPVVAAVNAAAFDPTA